MSDTLRCCSDSHFLRPCLSHRTPPGSTLKGVGVVRPAHSHGDITSLSHTGFVIHLYIFTWSTYYYYSADILWPSFSYWPVTTALHLFMIVFISIILTIIINVNLNFLYQSGSRSNASTRINWFWFVHLGFSENKLQTNHQSSLPEEKAWCSAYRLPYMLEIRCASKWHK